MKIKEFSNGGVYSEYKGIDKSKSDYKLVKNIGIEFARMGEEVKTTPKLHFKSIEYQQIYRLLIGTKYYGKCPDILVGSKFFEVESYVPPLSKRKVDNMFTRGLSQSNNIVIDNSKGITDRRLKKIINNRIRLGQNINEVWLYEKGKIRLLYKKQ